MIEFLISPAYQFVALSWLIPNFDKVPHFVSRLNKKQIAAWLLNIPVSFFVVGYLGKFYASGITILLITALLHSLLIPFFSYLWDRLQQKLISEPINAWMAIILAISVLIFFIAIIRMALRYPSLFQADKYLVPPTLILYFVIGVLAALPGSVWTSDFIGQKNLSQSRIFRFVDENLSGILLSILFFAVYFFLANIFNQDRFKFDDIFFDTDAQLWRWRLGTDQYRDYYQRPVHPFVLIILRPLIWIVSLAFKGDMLHGAYTLLAMSGALSVFLVWYFVKRTTFNSIYALLIGGLFGGTTSQLVYGSIIETYGFLGTTALIFIIILLTDAPLYAQVIAGLATFGITVSNYAQTVITHIMIKHNFRQWVIYGVICVLLFAPLSLFNNAIYPDAAPYFWDKQALTFEDKNVFTPNFQRLNYLGRVMLLNSFVAPEPILLKEDTPFLKVWMFRADIKNTAMQIAKYETPFETAMAYIWFGLVLSGVVLFLKNIRNEDNRYTFAFIITLLFYFALHSRYGKDVFLYAANWTYAIILMMALMWREVSNKKWFQYSLLGFVIFLLVNNTRIILFMLASSFLHYR